MFELVCLLCLCLLAVLVIAVAVHFRWLTKITTAYEGEVKFAGWATPLAHHSEYSFANVRLPNETQIINVRVPKSMRRAVGEHPKSLSVVQRQAPMVKPWIEAVSFNGGPFELLEEAHASAIYTSSFASIIILMPGRFIAARFESMIAAVKKSGAENNVN